MSLIYVFFLLKLVSASNVGLIENSTWQSNLTALRFSATALGDVDNDNDLDLALIGCLNDGANNCENGVRAKIYLNNGSTLTENSTWQSNLTAVGDGSLAWADLDNDGDLDLALSGCTSSTSIISCNGNRVTKIYINNGTSLVENSTWQSNLTIVSDSSMSIGDVDNDGDLDLAMNGLTSTDVSKIYLNNGTSLVENSTWQSNLIGIFEGQMALGDVDNDGDLDLAQIGDNGNSAFVNFYTNNGTALVENSTWKKNLSSRDQGSVLFGDYNNDGDLDLMTCGLLAGDRCNLHDNNGSTLLLNQTVNGGCLPGLFRASIAFGDYNNDGYLDLAAIGNEAGRAIICENNETNDYNFDNDALAHSNISDNILHGALTFGDLDNDGDLDLIIVGLDSVSGLIAKIFINNNTVSNTKPSAPTDFFGSTYSNNVLKLGWGNGSDTETNISGLYYNLMIGNSTKNHTVVSGIYGGSSGGGGGAGGGASGYFGNMMQRKNITLYTKLEASTNYSWYVQTIDTGLAKSDWSARQSFVTSADVNKPNVTLQDPSPNNSIHTTNPYFIFNASVIDVNPNNVSLYADFNGTLIVNETNSSGINSNYTFTKNLTNLNDSLYQWYISACDDDSNCQSSGSRNFYLDRKYPIVSSITANETTSISASVTFEYNVSDTDIANCSLIIDGIVDQTDTSVTENTTETFTKSMSNGDYKWYVNCSDYVGFVNSSASRSLTVSVSSGGSGGGGGGGGGVGGVDGGIVITPPKLEKFDVDFSKITIGVIEVKQGDVKIFSFNSKIKHSITLITLTQDSVTLLIISDPITIQIKLGEKKQIDVNEDNIDDFEVKLVSIVSGKAKFFLTKLKGADIVGREELEELVRKEALFDVKVSIENLFEIVKSRREVIAKIEVFNINNIGQVDVVIDYYITSKNNQTKLVEGSDTLAVEAVASFVRSLRVPRNLKSGKYLFNVDIKYKDKIMASGNAEFNVIKSYEIITALGVILLIVVGIFFYLWRIKKKEEKLEFKEKKLERKEAKLEREVKRLKKKSGKSRWRIWR